MFRKLGDKLKKLVDKSIKLLDKSIKLLDKSIKLVDKHPKFSINLKTVSVNPHHWKNHTFAAEK
ncbi:hypothetical protein CWD94_13730 [Lysinibacillus xylanilyticus]|uniref:Uncharacterized protein n=1 Tax=Lysinibacillus xylanilyticus TaxID=582475 RepID=A0A2M9Q437_9BACI|nr:hypothetical protein CWD94_13730 [Lysinibacillus xylanilyticus]